MSKRDIINAVLIDSDDDEIIFTKIITKEIKESEETDKSERLEEPQEEKIKRKRTFKPKIELNTCFNIDSDIIEIGIDEVGRGPLFGRVYASAVVLPKSNDFKHNEMKDSKKFSSKKKIEFTC